MAWWMNRWVDWLMDGYIIIWIVWWMNIKDGWKQNNEYLNTCLASLTDGWWINGWINNGLHSTEHIFVHAHWMPITLQPFRRWYKIFIHTLTHWHSKRPISSPFITESRKIQVKNGITTKSGRVYLYSIVRNAIGTSSERQWIVSIGSWSQMVGIGSRMGPYWNGNGTCRSLLTR